MFLFLHKNSLSLVSTLLFGLLLFCPEGTRTVLAAEIGEQVERTGDEIMVCGQLFHTTAPVVLWTDPKGYDAYRVENRFGDFEKSDWKEPAGRSCLAKHTPNRYGIRKDQLTAEQLAPGPWRRVDVAAAERRGRSVCHALRRLRRQPTVL